MMLFAAVKRNRAEGWMKPKLNQICRPLRSTQTQTHTDCVFLSSQGRHGRQTADRSGNNAYVDATDIFSTSISSTIMLHPGDGFAPPQTTTRQPPHHPVIAEPHSCLDFIMRWNGNHHWWSARTYETMIQCKSCLTCTESGQEGAGEQRCNLVDK